MGFFVNNGITRSGGWTVALTIIEKPWKQGNAALAALIGRIVRTAPVSATCAGRKQIGFNRIGKMRPVTIAWLSALGMVFLVGNATTASGKQRSRGPVVTSASHEACMEVPNLGPEYPSCCTLRRKYNEWLQRRLDKAMMAEGGYSLYYQNRSGFYITERLAPKEDRNQFKADLGEYCVQTVSTSPMCAYVTKVSDHMGVYDNYRLPSDDRASIAVGDPLDGHPDVRARPTFRGVDYLLDTPNPNPQFSLSRARRKISRTGRVTWAYVGNYTAGNIQREWFGSCADGLLDGPGALHTTVRSIQVYDRRSNKKRYKDLDRPRRQSDLKLDVTTRWTKQYVKEGIFHRGQLVLDGHFAERATCSGCDTSFPTRDISGSYVNGERDGHWRFENDSKVEEGPFVQGVRDGHWRFEDGSKVEEGPLVQGVRHGHWRIEDGPVAKEGLYDLGEPHDQWTYRREYGGITEGGGNYVNGQKHGDWIELSGEIGVARGAYLNGKKHGPWVVGEWISGSGPDVLASGSYRLGARHGDWIEDGGKSFGFYQRGNKQGEWLEASLRCPSAPGGYIPNARVMYSNGKKVSSPCRKPSEPTVSSRSPEPPRSPEPSRSSNSSATSSSSFLDGVLSVAEVFLGTGSTGSASAGRGSGSTSRGSSTSTSGGSCSAYAKPEHHSASGSGNLNVKVQFSVEATGCGGHCRGFIEYQIHFNYDASRETASTYKGDSVKWHSYDGSNRANIVDEVYIGGSGISGDSNAEVTHIAIEDVSCYL